MGISHRTFASLLGLVLKSNDPRWSLGELVFTSSLMTTHSPRSAFASVLVNSNIAQNKIRRMRCPSAAHNPLLSFFCRILPHHQYPIPQREAADPDNSRFAAFSQPSHVRQLGGETSPSSAPTVQLWLANCHWPERRIGFRRTPAGVRLPALRQSRLVYEQDNRIRRVSTAGPLLPTPLHFPISPRVSARPLVPEKAYRKILEPCRRRAQPSHSSACVYCPLPV